MDSVLSDFNSYSENYRRPSCFKATRASSASPGGFAPAPSTQPMHMMTPPVTVITSKAAVSLN